MSNATVYIPINSALMTKQGDTIILNVNSPMVLASDYDQLKEQLWHSEMAAEAEAHRVDELKAERDQLKAENERLKCITQSKHAELYEEQQRRFEGNRLTSAEHHEELQELNREHTHKIVALTIQVEKLLCEKLGREWSASGISIETLTNDLASERDTLRKQLDEARELLMDYGYSTGDLDGRVDAWLEANK